MCLKKTNFGPNCEKAENQQYFTDVECMPDRENLRKACVLPKGHKEKCSYKFNILNKSKQAKKLEKSIELAIFQTPGDDDYVYKNRSQRIDRRVLAKDEELKIRDKKIKKKCAIPLKEASTSILMAQAYMDWITYMVSIKRMEDLLDNSSPHYPEIMKMISINKKHLQSKFLNHKLFNEDGNTICVITRKEIQLLDVSDPDRDNRKDIRDTDVQMGHNYPRSEDYCSIRGENLFVMSRRGNLIIGENIFTEDAWINELKGIVSIHQ